MVYNSSVTPKDKSTDSVQGEKDAQVFLNNFLNFITKVDVNLPEYSSDTRERDRALKTIYKSEPFLAGVMNTMTSIDQNKPWSIMGTARQVATYGNKLHNVNDGAGWRDLVLKLSENYYSSNFGYAGEIGFRFSGSAPAETIYSMDVTKMRKTSDPNFPFYYYSNDGKVYGLTYDEVLYANSMPSSEDRFKGAGFCAVERSLTFARMFIGLHQHHLEKFNVSPPKGILLAKGIQKHEMNSAIEQFEQARNSSSPQSYQIYRDLIGIMTGNHQADIDLIGLSDLPDNFELQQFVDVLINGIALAFGTSTWLLYSRNTTAVTRSNESKQSLEEAKHRSEKDFALSLQSEIQRKFLPPSVSFRFNHRTEEDEARDLENDKNYTDMIYQLTDNKNRDQILDVSEARYLLAEKGIIPKSWSEKTQEDSEITSLMEIRQQAYDDPQVQRAAYENPDQPIVVYEYNPRNVNRVNYNYEPNYEDYKLHHNFHFPSEGKTRVLWPTGDKMIRKRYL